MVGLLDEAAGRDDGSLFIVGDRKQAIYGWRGGDVRLFDEVESRFGGDGELEVRTMPRSWRSCPAVLDLVNRVCGAREPVGRLFGEGLAARWRWEPHSSARPDLAGEARVEVVGRNDHGGRLVELLAELGIGRRALTCGVLVRTNRQVRSTAALLRAHGFDVIEEGCRQPVGDNPAGVALLHLLRWLADPADRFADEMVAMSPLANRLAARFGEPWQRSWEGMLEEVAASGFAATIEQLLEPLWPGLSEFARRRVGDVIGALAEFDAAGGTTARDALRRLSGLEIQQGPGVAAVQVMTIHKAKGLGFDVVVLPGLDDDQVPNRGDFRVASGTTDSRPWLLQPPPDWVRDLVPPLREVEGQWADDQRYEMMCVLYVALTRARQGLYLLLPAPPPSRGRAGASWASPANLVAQALGGWDAADDGPSFRSGDPGWLDEVEVRPARPQPPAPSLAPGRPMRPRSTPSGQPAGTATGAPEAGGGAGFGREVHAAFEQVRWLDDGPDRLGDGPAARLVRECLASAPIAALFERRSGVEVLVEQPLEVILDGKWVSGVVDRLLVERDATGAATAATVVDFKTDRIDDQDALVERHASQMNAYRRAVAMVLGLDPAVVTCLLVSTALRCAVPVPPR
jgi:ATP-dependent exoDNAse (exonuclease V) beta subunit